MAAATRCAAMLAALLALLCVPRASANYLGCGGGVGYNCGPGTFCAPPRDAARRRDADARLAAPHVLTSADVCTPHRQGKA